jgi:hypothetical protein
MQIPALRHNVDELRNCALDGIYLLATGQFDLLIERYAGLLHRGEVPPLRTEKRARDKVKRLC